jgi:hypothetical protein
MLFLGKQEGQISRNNNTRWIILRWILERYDGMVWTGLVWLRIATNGGLL